MLRRVISVVILIKSIGCLIFFSRIIARFTWTINVFERFSWSLRPTKHWAAAVNRGSLSWNVKKKRIENGFGVMTSSNPIKTVVNDDRKLTLCDWYFKQRFAETQKQLDTELNELTAHRSTWKNKNLSFFSFASSAANVCTLYTRQDIFRVRNAKEKVY